ncbi:MAG: hypothetical protein Q9164_005548, partial [Protoblastenia rupestris]
DTNHTTIASLDDSPTNSVARNSSPPTSLYGFDLFEEPSIEADVDETTWAAIKTKYEFFDYAALHRAYYFSDCTEAVTEENMIPALAICRADTTHAANWFKHFWYKNVQPGPFPAVIDALMIASCFGLVSILLRLLRDPECIDPPPPKPSSHGKSKRSLRSDSSHTRGATRLAARPS